MCYKEHIDKSMMTIIGPIRLPIHSWPLALSFGNLRPQGKVLYKTLCYFQIFYETANVNFIYTENFLCCTLPTISLNIFPFLFLLERHKCLQSSIVGCSNQWCRPSSEVEYMVWDCLPVLLKPSPLGSR